MVCMDGHCRQGIAGHTVNEAFIGCREMLEKGAFILLHASHLNAGSVPHIYNLSLGPSSWLPFCFPRPATPEQPRPY